MMKKILKDVGVQGRNPPRKPEAEPRDELVERAGVGTSNPLQEGLPSLVVVAMQDLVAQGEAQGTPKGMPKGTPKKASGGPTKEVWWPPRTKPLKNITVEGERPVSPPQPTTRPPLVGEDVEMVD
ncbi:unnamed protein product [Calypogeia fissa]